MNIPARQIVAGDVVRIDGRTLGIHVVRLPRSPTVEITGGEGDTKTQYDGHQVSVSLEPDEMVEVVSMWKTKNRPS